MARTVKTSQSEQDVEKAPVNIKMENRDEQQDEVQQVTRRSLR